ncbi:MAG: ADP-ribosylglycohydrolase family protein [Nostocaceae cyanobacterium]|nr:ADP-ribosylglycohydrolase family protein [Nostocaceae cyanobacterium]
MKFSVLSRFRGSLLGALIAEARVFETLGLSEIQAMESHQPLIEWGEIAVIGAKSIISQGTLDIDDWLNRQKQVYPQSQAIEESSPKAILSVLPVALFFHDNPVKLRENLLKAINLWQNQPIIRDGALAIGYAIAQAVGETLNPVTLIEQTISFLGNTETCIPQFFLKVNKLLAQGAGLEEANSELNREQKPAAAIALAFYCFLSTPDDFRLAVERGTQIVGTHGLTSVLTAAISGAYNSTIGIPLRWHPTTTKKARDRINRVSTKWGMNNEAEMLELAECLFAVWAGMYQITLNNQEFSQKAAISTPDVIRLT